MDITDQSTLRAVVAFVLMAIIFVLALRFCWRMTEPSYMQTEEDAADDFRPRSQAAQANDFQDSRLQWSHLEEGDGWEEER